LRLVAGGDEPRALAALQTVDDKVGRNLCELRASRVHRANVIAALQLQSVHHKILNHSPVKITTLTRERLHMLSRRSLLRLGPLGVGRRSPPACPAQRGGAPAPTGPLPPSIAALTSMRDRARPFTKQERLARIEKARRLMAAEKIDAILMNGGSSPVYFANM